jgi:hypothetical protein
MAFAVELEFAQDCEIGGIPWQTIAQWRRSRIEIAIACPWGEIKVAPD